MKVINRSPFKFAPLTGRYCFPGYSLVLIAKGTFDLKCGDIAELAEEQMQVCADILMTSDSDVSGSCRYESDFAHFKPCTDLLLAGSCHAPAKKPVRACDVAFQVGSTASSLRVSGDRHWSGRPGFRKASEPEPFIQKTLCYENSFGGEGYGPNPVGKGFRGEKDESGQKYWPLPNIENPTDLVESPRDRPQPAGFAPLSREWQARASLLGSYKGDWVKTRWPWYAKDFDYAHFNAAPRPLQVAGYLRGDEKIVCKNMHPEHARYDSGLPGLKVRCFLDVQTDDPEPIAEFREVSMNLDTLWVDMDAEKLVLVWRGWTEVRSDDYEEMQHVFIMSESVENEPATVEQCREHFYAALAEAGDEPEPEEPEDESPAEPDDDQVGPEAEEAEPAMDKVAIRDQAKAQLGVLMAKAGFDLNDLAPESRERVEQQQNQIFDTMMENDPKAAMARQREAMQAQMSAALAEIGIDLDDLPQVSEAAAKEQIRFLQELGVEDVDAVLGNPEMAGFFGIMAAALPKVGIDPENLTPLIEAAKKNQAQAGQKAEQKDNSEPTMAEEESSPWTRELVQEAAAQGVAFAEEDLSGLDLSGLDLAGCDFTDANLSEVILGGTDLTGAILAGADLTKAILTEANLYQTNLAGADLTGAVLDKANLESADLTDAKLAGADLSGATLDEAQFMEAGLSGANLAGVQAVGAVFIGAEMTEARFSGGNLRIADFSRGDLSKADLGTARMDNASIEGATCVEAKFDGADLTCLRASEGTDFSRCSFVRIKGPESIWGQADLTGANFSFAQMAGASFMDAKLRNANLYGADLKHARFTKADLSGAKLVRMNLFKGSLEKANLTGADLSKSNMYAVEFLDAELEDTTLKGANLRMSKLQDT